jgi:ligand-binding sensor domain-containing protein/signal transduction histidine kinase/DNA-binding response OmpR family regulator
MKLNLIICHILWLLAVVSLKSFSNEKRFDKIDMSTGLSHNSALCLLEDHEGFVWIGTRDGLNKFDGANFEVYKHIFSDSSSLVNNQVNCLFETKNHEIWIGTANGLCVYNPEKGKFSTFSLSTTSKRFDSYYIRTIFETSNGELWIGTTTGLYIIDKDRKSFKLQLIHPDKSDKANNVHKIFQDASGTIWLGTKTGLYKKGNDSFELFLFEPDVENTQHVVRVREIIESEKGFLWIGTENKGIFVLNNQFNEPKLEFKINTGNSELSSNIVRAIYYENDENVWIGTFNGLCNYNTITKKCSVENNLTRAQGSISNTSVKDIIGDSQGGIWFAIYVGGVNYYHQYKNMFQHHLWQTGNVREVKNTVITALCEDKQKNLWIGSEGFGIYKSEDAGISISKHLNFSETDITENTVKALTLANNNLWIGTLAGLCSYNLTSKKIKKYYHEPGNSNSLNSGYVLAILHDTDDKLWIGLNGGGVQTFNPSTSHFTNVEIEPLKEEYVSCFLKDSNGNIWIGSGQELFLLNGSDNNLIDLSKKVENWLDNEIDVIFVTEDSENNIWFGTRGRGLYLISNNKLFWFNTGNGLIDDTVNSLLEGGNNEYWITTNKGLSKIELKEAENGKMQIESHTYSLSQGVQGLQFFPKCAFISSSGKLFFGGINGLNSFYQDDIIANESYPNLVLTEFRVDYKQMQPGEPNSPLVKSLNKTTELILDYNQRDFSISFAGLNFVNPDKNNYRYKVLGLNDTWIEMGNKNNINFTYFPVGTYDIRLQVSTDAQKWGAEYRSLQITVLPPWWETWWAFLIYSFVLALSLVLFFVLSQRWARMKNQLLMHNFQREKENELHQLKLKFYTDVSHELRTPLTLILAPIENLISKTELSNRFRNQLLQIQRSGFRLMQLVNQILDLRKLETGHEQLQVAEGNIIRFFSEISLAFKEVASSKNIDFEFISHKEELSLWFERDKLEIILNNLLSNAFKFTPEGGKVKLVLSEIDGANIQEQFSAINKKNTYLQISILDSGEGIKPEDLLHIYNRFYSKEENNKVLAPGAGVGLELTKRMIELHKGGISVVSNDVENNKKETIFSIFISMNRNVYSESELDFDYKNSEDPSLYTKEFLQRETILDVNDTEEEKPVHVDENEFERLLIVEDNDEVRSFIRELFADDYEISEAENGKSGLEKAIETNPQLIISDVMMPVMDGIELCKKIKTDARTSHIPVILLTARTALTFKYEGLETGADDYITKPFSTRYLSLRVKNLIKQRKSIHEHFKREAICDPGSVTLTSVDEKILKKAVDYITENMADSSINVNKISAHVGLSRVHFYRKIKALTSQTAVEFIRNIRLKRAATLLRQNKLSVKEARNMVGFEDADYFRDCFKEQFGVTPSEYTSDKS